MFRFRLIYDTLRHDGLSVKLAVIGARLLLGIDTVDMLQASDVIDTTEYYTLVRAGVL